MLSSNRILGRRGGRLFFRAEAEAKAKAVVFNSFSTSFSTSTSPPSSPPNPNPNPNTLPNNNILIQAITSHAPSFLPYALLARMDKPIGTMLLLHPCLWSLSLATIAIASPASTFTSASASASAPIPLHSTLTLIGLFSAGAFAMRGAGCTINDMWDVDIDRQVSRTKSRPLASGLVSLPQAWVFLGGQLAVGLAVLCSFPAHSLPLTMKLGVLSLPLVVLYPTAKRWTNYPQLVLGLTFNAGAVLGCAAVANEVLLPIVAPLYFSGVCWTMVYDTIYAMQDEKDDRKIGVKSSALALGANRNQFLYMFSGAFGGERACERSGSGS